MKNKYLISLPYLYPVCPISIDHARMFVVADINARLQRKNGKEVFFPIAAHFSGVTAENTCKLLNSRLEKNNQNYEQSINMHNIFSKIYKIPNSILNLLKTPEDILYFFTYQTLSDLKEINVSCNYDSFYTTYEGDFEIFVRAMFQKYEENDKLFLNDKKELALNYNDKLWKDETIKELERLEFIQKFHKNNVSGAFNNVREDFGLLRNYGIGIRYNDEYVIDPMFDSDLFTIYDLYMKYKVTDSFQYNSEDIFKELFARLNSEKVNVTTEIVDNILKWLPCDLFVCEEHLKTWIVKKTYSETLLLKPQYRTQKYFITGMGNINNERMSSSRGTAVLLKDLIEEYGKHNARLIILMTGGHPSKLYNYDLNLPSEVMRMTRYFKEYINYLYSTYLKNKNISIVESLDKERTEIQKNIENGYYQQAIVYMMKIMPKLNKDITSEKAKAILELYKEYLEILVPNFLNIEL